MSTINFISAAYFKERFPTTVNDGTIEQAIASAMYKHVARPLGSGLFDDLKAKVAASGITGNDALLMLNYVKPLTREWTQYELFAIKGVRIEETGIYQNQPDNTKAADIPTIKYWREDSKWFAEQLAEELKKYLNDNRDLFPAYVSTDQFINPSHRNDDWDIGIS